MDKFLLGILAAVVGFACYPLFKSIFRSVVGFFYVYGNLILIVGGAFFYYQSDEYRNARRDIARRQKKRFELDDDLKFIRCVCTRYECDCNKAMRPSTFGECAECRLHTDRVRVPFLK
jgi:hypothetical protein